MISNLISEFSIDAVLIHLKDTSGQDLENGPLIVIDLSGNIVRRIE